MGNNGLNSQNTLVGNFTYGASGAQIFNDYVIKVKWLAIGNWEWNSIKMNLNDGLIYT